MSYNSIHETVVADIFDTIRDGVKLAGQAISPHSAKVRNASSLAKATSGLTLVFPVICTNTLPIETATMIAKAIERKNVSLLQIAFSAYNITNATDAISHLSKFHQNLNMSKMDLDKFMDTMEALGEDAIIYPAEAATITEDCKYNTSYTLGDNINETSLLQYAQVTRYGNPVIVKEAYPRPQKLTPNGYEDMNDDEIKNTAYAYDDETYKGWTNARKDAQRYLDRKSQEDIAKANRDSQDARADRDYNRQLAKDKSTASDQKRQYFAAQLLPSDVKKANEMQPSLILVNYYVNDADRDLNIAQQAVAGVKSKLYAVDSSDIINKIITKHIDSDILLKLVKVSTREISFIKDFLLGLDDAKLDALSKSRKGSASKIFKALERRSIRGKIRKSLRLENSAKAISTLVISAEEAEELKKYQNIDIYQPSTIIPIMEKLNLLYFVIVDTVTESIDIITDGETEYESYSFTALEREAGDGAYKKVINLMTKLS